MLFVTFQWLGFLVFLGTIYWRSRPLDPRLRQLALDFGFILVVGLVLGGRLFHIFVEQWDYYRDHPLAWFEFSGGGFTLVGGVILAAVLSYGWAKRKGLDWWSWMDYLTPLFSPLYMWGRLGCFLEGCCYGHWCDLPWAIGGRHPTQIYAILGEFGVWVWVLSTRRLQGAYFRGYLFLTWLMGHSLMRLLVMEPFRADERGPLWQGQWSISSGLWFLAFVLAVLLFLWFRNGFIQGRIPVSCLTVTQSSNKG